MSSSGESRSTEHPTASEAGHGAPLPTDPGHGRLCWEEEPGWLELRSRPLKALSRDWEVFRQEEGLVSYLKIVKEKPTSSECPHKVNAAPRGSVRAAELGAARKGVGGRGHRAPGGAPDPCPERGREWGRARLRPGMRQLGNSATRQLRNSRASAQSAVGSWAGQVAPAAGDPRSPQVRNAANGGRRRLRGTLPPVRRDPGRRTGRSGPPAPPPPFWILGRDALGVPPTSRTDACRSLTAN